MEAVARMAGAKSRELAKACQATDWECLAANPVCLVHLVGLVYRVDPVSLVQPNKQDKPNKPIKRDRPDRPNRPNEQDRPVDLLEFY